MFEIKLMSVSSSRGMTGIGCFVWLMNLLTNKKWNWSSHLQFRFPQSSRSGSGARPSTSPAFRASDATSRRPPRPWTWSRARRREARRRGGPGRSSGTTRSRGRTRWRRRKRGRWSGTISTTCRTPGENRAGVWTHAPETNSYFFTLYHSSIRD